MASHGKVIGKAPSSGLPSGQKWVEKPHFAVLCHRTYTIEDPFGYFPNSFWKKNSANYFACIGFSEVGFCGPLVQEMTSDHQSYVENED